MGQAVGGARLGGGGDERLDVRGRQRLEAHEAPVEAKGRKRLHPENVPRRAPREKRRIDETSRTMAVS